MKVAQYNSAVEQYADNLFRFAVKNLRDEEKARDVVQDTFEKLWLKRENVQAEKVRSYLFSTCYHTLIDRVRRDKKQGSMEEANFQSMSHERQYSDLQEILHEALEQLPEIQRSVILLRDYEGYSYQEIGDMTNLSESQVKVYIFRARKFLKNYLVSVDMLI
ncbi:MAG: RNA polymerase sigma factor [Salibacteraceae bacterium]